MPTPMARMLHFRSPAPVRCWTRAVQGGSKFLGAYHSVGEQNGSGNGRAVLGRRVVSVGF